MTKKFKQTHELLIADLETVKVMSDPLRIQVIEAMINDPITVKQVAGILGMPPSKLYYHIGLLEKHGLIVVVDTQIVSGIVEKWYQTAASSFRIDRNLFKSEGGGDSFYDLLTTVFDSTVADIRRALEKDIIKLGEDAPRSQRLKISRTRAFLTSEQAAEMYARIDELLEEFDAYGEGSRAEGARAYALTVALYPFDENAFVPAPPEESSDD